MENLLSKLRIAIGDKAEPYIYDDDELTSIIEVATYEYSKYRPIKRLGVLNFEIDIKEYVLPDDYQTWIEGLEDYKVYEKILVLEDNPLSNYSIKYVYYADRKVNEIPVCDLSLIIDYSFFYIIDSAVKEGSDISTLKLGKGLQISFDNISELNKSAMRRLENFNSKLKASCIGSWT